MCLRFTWGVCVGTNWPCAIQRAEERSEVGVDAGQGRTIARWTGGRATFRSKGRMMEGQQATCTFVSMLGLAGRCEQDGGCTVDETVKLSRNKCAPVHLYGDPQMAEINSVPVSTGTGTRAAGVKVDSSGKVSHTQATDTLVCSLQVSLPPTNQTRDLTTSPPHLQPAEVAGEPLWCAPDGGSRTTPAGILAKKQTWSSSYHLGTAFAWLVGLRGPDRELPLSRQEYHHTFERFRFHQSRTTVSANLHVQVSPRHRDATSTSGVLPKERTIASISRCSRLEP